MKTHLKTHRHFLESMVAFFAALVFAGTVSVFFEPGVSKALSLSLNPYISYDVTVISEAVPAIPNLGCPYYYYVNNNFINPDNPFPKFGLFVLPGSEADTYDNKTLVIPGTRHLGGYIPEPQLACGSTPAGTPVFPIFFNTFFFLDGGTLTPSLSLP